MLLLLGCTPVFVDTARQAPEYAVPGIVSAVESCSVSDAKWTFQVDTDAWTGNGALLFSTDGAYVERHPMYSSGAAYDGTSDTLKLTLYIVPDFRDVVVGSTTVFNCDVAALAGIFQVYERDGRTLADCRAFGADPERWAEWDEATACDTLLDTGGTGDTGDTGE